MTSPEQPGLDRTRLRPGGIASIVDISTWGVLVETDWRLLPGSHLDIEYGCLSARLQVRGTVVRSQVVAIAPGLIRYRGAVSFETQLPIGEATTHEALASR